MIVGARPLRVLELMRTATHQGKDAKDLAKHHIKHAGIAEGANIGGIVIASASHFLDARPGFVEVDADKGVLFIVFESDIEARMMVADQGPFEEECFHFSASEHEIKVVNVSDKDFGLVPIDLPMKIAQNSILEIAGLAHIDDGAGRILHQVNAWSAWEAP